MIAVSDRDRAIVAQAGPAILQSGWTGDAASVRERALAAGGWHHGARLRADRQRREPRARGRSPPQFGADAGTGTCSKQKPEYPSETSRSFLMEIGYTPEQLAMQRELRTYYEKLLDPATVAELHASHGGRGGAPPHLEADVRRRLGGHRLAQGVRRSGALGDRAVHLLRRVDARRCAGADAHDQQRRPDDHGLRHRRAEGRLPAADPRRRHPLLHRLLRARRRHRPRVAEDARRARRRRRT